MRLFVFAALFVALSTALAAADTITLTTGETLLGKVVQQTEDAVTFDHPVLGQLTIPAGKVKAVVVGAPDAETKPVAPPEAPPAAPAPKPAEKTGFFGGWKARLEAGANAADGNSEYLNLYLAFKAKKEDKRDRWAFDSAYFLNQSQGQRSKDQFYAALRKDWLVPDTPWYYFAEGRFDYDRFASYDQRLSAAAGAGYEWIKTDKITLGTRLGLGASREFGSQDQNIRPEALVGADLDWKIDDGQTLAAKTTYYPDLGQLGEFRWLNAVEWLIKINRDNGISLKLGAEHEHNSAVDPGVKNNDVKLYAALVWDF
jgi:putative salt-induced outer membrane protein YdiY